MTSCTLRVAVAVCCLTALAGFAADLPESEVHVLSGATVIDGTGAAPRSNVTLVVKNGLIASMSEGASRTVPEGTTVIDLEGKYVIPGLIDSHTHFFPVSEREKMLKKALYGGVTAMREMGGDARISSALARAAKSGMIEAPDIHFSAVLFGPGFMNDPRVKAVARGLEPGTAPWMRVVDDDSDLEAIIRDARVTGATGVKLYSSIAPPLLGRIVEEAHRQGMKVWSHATVFPSRPSDAVAAGVDLITHNGMLFPESAEELPGDFATGTVEWMAAQDFASVDPADEMFDALFKEMVRRGTIYEPTLAGSEALEQRAQKAGRGGIDWTALRKWGCAATRAAHEAGVLIAAGTDMVGPTPVLRELELLVECGLSPLEAIRAATLNNAMAIGIEKTHGTIAAGKVANLVVLSKDPSMDISNVRDLVFVMKEGKIFGAADKQREARRSKTKH